MKFKLINLRLIDPYLSRILSVSDWLLVAVASINTFQCITQFAKQTEVAKTIAEIQADLAKGNNSDAVVAQWGATQLAICMICWLVIARYQAIRLLIWLISPLIWAIFLIEQLYSGMIKHLNPVETDVHPRGMYWAFIFLFLSLTVLVFRRWDEDKKTAGCSSLINSVSSKFGILTALAIPLMLVAGGAVHEFKLASVDQSVLQIAVDSAAIAAAQEPDTYRRYALVDRKLSGSGVSPLAKASVTNNPDDSVTVSATSTSKTAFMTIFGWDTIPISAKATAIASSAASSTDPCLNMLARNFQSLSEGSRAIADSNSCEFDVQ